MKTNANTLFTPGTPYRQGVEVYPLPQLDLQSAYLLLASAGYVQSNASGVWMSAATSSSAPMPLSFVLTYTNTDPVQTALATAHVRPVAVPRPQRRFAGPERWRLGDACAAGHVRDFFAETWGAPYDPQSSVEAFWTNDNGGVYALANTTGGIQALSAEVTAIISEQSVTTRQADWTRILQTLHSNGVFFPISYTTNQAVYSADVQGVCSASHSATCPCPPCSARRTWRHMGGSKPAASYAPHTSALTLWAVAVSVIGLLTGSL
jgi:ABC-type transport system substrate-binding protein